jgi:hypothetical protein
MGASHPMLPPPCSLPDIYSGPGSRQRFWLRELREMSIRVITTNTIKVMSRSGIKSLVLSIICCLPFPLMAASSGGYPFVFFSAMMVVQFFVVLFLYPETKGITLEDMQRKLGIA